MSITVEFSSHHFLDLLHFSWAALSTAAAKVVLTEAGIAVLTAAGTALSTAMGIASLTALLTARVTASVMAFSMLVLVSKGEEHWKLESYAMVRMLKIRLLCFVVVAQKLRSRVVVKQEGHRRRSSEEGVMEIALAR